MANNYGLSEAAFSLAKEQAARRTQLRQEFMKQRTNPWKHAAEAGYVFDPAVQKFNSMKVTQFEFFQPNRRTSLFAIFAIVIPMSTYGYLIWKDRSTREAKIRAGEIKYKDRLFKFQ